MPITSKLISNITWKLREAKVGTGSSEVHLGKYLSAAFVCVISDLLSCPISPPVLGVSPPCAGHTLVTYNHLTYEVYSLYTTGFSITTSVSLANYYYKLMYLKTAQTQRSGRVYQITISSMFPD